jgi:hypothetical protein
MSLNKAPSRDIINLQNWVDGTGSLARDETDFLGDRNELVSLAPDSDSAIAKLEFWLEDNLIRFYRGFRQV